VSFLELYFFVVATESKSEPIFRQISSCDVLNRLAGGLTFVGLFILESHGYKPDRTGHLASKGNSTIHLPHDENALTPDSIATIRALHCFFPAACVAVAGLCSLLYSLDRSAHSELVKAIAALDTPAVVELHQNPAPSSSSEVHVCDHQPTEVTAKNEDSPLDTPGTHIDQVCQSQP
jgi:hypothetical protein